MELLLPKKDAYAFIKKILSFFLDFSLHHSKVSIIWYDRLSSYENILIYSFKTLENYKRSSHSDDTVFLVYAPVLIEKYVEMFNVFRKFFLDKVHNEQISFIGSILPKPFVKLQSCYSNRVVIFKKTTEILKQKLNSIHTIL